MTETPWASSIADWDVSPLDGEFVRPNDVLRLISAHTAGEARSAYWRLDGSVCLSGVMNRSALPVVQTLLGAYSQWTSEATPWCLELLGQIAAAEPASDANGADCEVRAELRQATWTFLDGLQFGAEENVALHVDILGLIAFEFAELRPKIKYYLEQSLRRALPASTLQMIRNTLEDL